jgi:uncharacterized membrane protein
VLSNAFTVSADGQTSAGISGMLPPSDAGASYSYRPVVWREGTEVARLPELPDMSDLRPEDMNADGKVIVGSGTLQEPASSDNMQAALRWSESGVERLPGLPSAALGVSADGAVIVGNRGEEATVWTSDLEPHSPAQLLTAAGVDLTGWSLTTACAVSADGKVVIGSANHDFRTFGFIAWLP